jgi:hypothetical protein
MVVNGDINKPAENQDSCNQEIDNQRSGQDLTVSFGPKAAEPSRLLRADTVDLISC